MNNLTPPCWKKSKPQKGAQVERDFRHVGEKAILEGYPLALATPADACGSDLNCPF